MIKKTSDSLADDNAFERRLLSLEFGRSTLSSILNNNQGTKKSRGTAFAFSLALLLLFASPVFATNGMLMTAYGARQAGMGGAFLAVGGSIMDLETNPAHLARTKESMLEVGSGIMFPSLTYRDSYTHSDPDTSYYNKINSEPAAFPLPYMGFTTPVGDRAGLGVAFYAQGGMGAEFNGILRNTPGQVTLTSLIQNMTGDPTASMPMIGNMKRMTENTYSNFGFARLTPGAAIRFGALSIGAGLDLGLAKLEWRWTFSDPFGMMEMPGAGYRYKSDLSYSMSGKVGLVYEITENVRVAYTYKARTKMYLNGDISINAGNPLFFRKLDTSMYLEWPESHNGGIAYQGDNLTLSLDLRYIKWSNVMNTVEFNIPYPWVQTPLGNYISGLPFSLKWRDQTVVAVGAEYKVSSIAYRVGYNYGRSPVDANGLNPLFPAISEHHASVGVGILGDNLDINIALEYAFPATVKGGDMSDWDMYHAFLSADLNGAQNPYFSHQVTMEQWIPHIGISYKF